SQQPQPAGDKAQPPVKREERAEEGRNTFSAPKTEPDGKKVAKECSSTRDQRRMGVSKRAGKQHRNRALAAVKQQGGEGCGAVSGTQHIGCANIARADLA